MDIELAVSQSMKAVYKHRTSHEMKNTHTHIYKNNPNIQIYLYNI